MLEVSDSLILAQQEIFYPLTKAIYVLLSGLESGTQVAAALGVWGMALLGTGILFATTLMGRRLGQMFRAG
jgi:iron(III) transport system permease protein